MTRQWRAVFIVSTKIIIGLILVLGFMFQGESRAQDNPKIKPGKYEITTKMRSSLDNSLSKKTIEKCIKGNTINPQSFLPDPERCSLNSLKESGNKSSFDILCTSPDGLNLKGSLEYSVQETSFSYKFKLEAPHNGGTFEVNSDGNAVRVGDC